MYLLPELRYNATEFKSTTFVLWFYFVLYFLNYSWKQPETLHECTTASGIWCPSPPPLPPSLPTYLCKNQDSNTTVLYNISLGKCIGLASYYVGLGQ